MLAWVGASRGARVVGLVIALALGCAGCATASPGAPGAARPGDSQPAERSAVVKRITVVTATIQLSMLPNYPHSGVDEFRLFVNPGLSVIDDQGLRRPVLAEALPTVENGLWKVSPDGRMETTWKLRPNIQWHDSAPFTTEDLAFTVRLGQDVPSFGDGAFAAIEEVTTPDALTITLKWNRPFINADSMFASRLALPVPAHLLQDAYRGDPASMVDLPFWTYDYVGAGPYRVREWVPDAYVMLEANGRYPLGRPKIDEIQLNLIPDANTIAANVLAGAVDLNLGSSSLAGIEGALELRGQWREGKINIEFGNNSWVVIWPQLLTPDPSVVGNLRFRRALLNAIDRQELVDSLQAGLVPVAHSFMSPDQPQYETIEARVPRYEYDPRKAIQQITELGYTQGSDGAMRDGAGRRLEVELRNATAVQTVAKSALAVADYWQKVGVATTAVPIPPQRVADWEYLATFSGFRLMSLGNDVRALPDLHSSRTRLPRNNFLVPGNGNWSRYANPEFDAFNDRYFMTIPMGERIQLLGQLIAHFSEHLVGLPLFYGSSPEIVSNRMVNVNSGRPTGSLLTWNAHQWDVRG